MKTTDANADLADTFAVEDFRGEGDKHKTSRLTVVDEKAAEIGLLDERSPNHLGGPATALLSRIDD